MDRRTFVSSLALGGVGHRLPPLQIPPVAEDVRSRFPRLAAETYLNGAGGTPLGTFAEDGISRFLDFIRLGPAEGRVDYFREVWSGVRGRFAVLIGADESEIGLVECTKRGEQIAIEGLDLRARGVNVVTNDLHFSGSLHHYEGLRRDGVDVRVVRADDSWAVGLDRMADAIDAGTALVAVSLVSNVTGTIEPMAELAEVAHAHGALVFADIIQAAGAVPVDVRAMGIDIAACSSYKWLFGVHGAGFVYVSADLQGGRIRDSWYPGGATRNYPPWVAPEAAGASSFGFSPPDSAVRYQPGHVNYMGYAAAYEGLGFIEEVGGPEAIRAHSSRLTTLFLESLRTDLYEVLTPQPEATPILALRAPSVERLVERLIANRIVVSLGGDLDGLIRVSPALYNDEDDVLKLAEVLNRG